MKVDGRAPEKIDFKVATNLYFIIQEAIKNASNHGNADSINIIFIMNEATLRLKIEDNGTGDTSSSEEDHGKGIQIMRHRMELLGGNFDIEKRPDSDGSGTRINCVLPLDSLDEDQDAVKW